MKTFIELKNRNGKILRLRPEQIESISQDSAGYVSGGEEVVETGIGAKSGLFYRVMETPKEILALLFD